jgi:hypothetical protein
MHFLAHIECKWGRTRLQGSLKDISDNTEIRTQNHYFVFTIVINFASDVFNGIRALYDVVSLFTTATYITLAMEFAFGFGLGYFAGKLVKAFIGLLALGFIGAMVNYTQFMALGNSLTQQLGVSQAQLMNVAGLILLFLGLTVIAPLTVGLILGFLVGG